MKSNVKKINNYWTCSTTFSSNKKEFTYISKFKSDLKGVAYQELKTDAIDKETLDQFKNKGCKNIEIELAELGFKVDGMKLLEERKAQLEIARTKDQKGQTPTEKIDWHKTRIANLESELEQAKADLKAEMVELKAQIEEAKKANDKLQADLEELSK